ncbi:hypothetical protein ACH5RR_038879 [Cinchona calisaya]|uniref:Calcineurin B-like protein n=1 Tax=Cinchona calisaya TaxID=153742 RepID=A0ABD2XYD2_9GENT
MASQTRSYPLGCCEKNVKRLEILPELPQGIEEVYADNCTLLQCEADQLAKYTTKRNDEIICVYSGFNQKSSPMLLETRDGDDHEATVREAQALFELLKSISGSVIDDGLINKVKQMLIALLSESELKLANETIEIILDKLFLRCDSFRAAICTIENRVQLMMALLPYLTNMVVGLPCDNVQLAAL